MKKLLIPLIILLTLTDYGFTQNNSASISGKIMNDAGIGAASASVALFTLKDSSLNKIAITSAAGEFEIKDLKPGKYFLNVTSIGYKKSSSNIFELKPNQAYFLATITLSTDHSKLTDINIQSKKPMIEVDADKTVFNVEGSINATGSNAFELVQKSPGVTIDNDDNISLKGKNGVRIYIDGKPSQLGGKDLSEFLRSINSADLEAIEMISNPSAKYDAAGNAGIINLRLKKNKNFGTNGSISTGAAFAYSPKANASFNINHRDRSINVFANYSTNIGRRRSFFDLYRIQNDSIYDQHTINTSDPHIHNFKTGVDVFLNAKSTIGVIVNGNFNKSTFSNQGSTTIMKNGAAGPQKILFSSGIQKTEKSNLNYNVNYHFNNNKGTEFGIDADLGQYTSRANSYQPNYYRTSSGALIEEKVFRNNTPTDIEIQTLKTDIELPAGKGKLGLGAKYSNVKTKNIFDFYNVISGNDVLDVYRSNKFNFTENINAGYINYNTQLSQKWTIRAGLRVENTISEGHLLSFQPQPDDNVKRNYVDFFPSTGLSHTFDEKNTFNLSYSRRIDRPNYADLNPFEEKIDELTYQKGNAFLRPQYTNIVEVSHTFKSRFNTALSYSHIKDFRANIIDTTEKNRVFRTVKNLASQDIFNINFSAPIELTKWWKIFINTNAYRSLYKADFGPDKIIDVSIIAYNFYTQQTFAVTDGLSFELTAFYNSPNVWGGSFETDAIYSADIGMQKLLFKKRGNLKLSFTDIFETLKFKGISNFGGAYLDVRGRSETRQFRVNFTYRFGRNEIKAARQRKTGLEEENSRISN